MSDLQIPKEIPEGYIATGESKPGVRWFLYDDDTIITVFGFGTNIQHIVKEPLKKPLSFDDPLPSLEEMKAEIY